jgi:hypothetical protein
VDFRAVLLRRVPLVFRRAVVFFRRVPEVFRRAVAFFRPVVDAFRRVVFFRAVVFLRRVPVVFFRPRVALRVALRVVLRVELDRLRLVEAALRDEDFFRAVERFRVDFLRDDAVDFFAVLLRRPVLLRRVLFLRVLDAERLLVGASCSPTPESSSPLLRNFFATPTAAGTATPSAAPAAIFFGVERPSSSPFDMTSSSVATVFPPLSGV